MRAAPRPPPTARGGSLRSQSLRRPAGDPVVLNGAILRVDPATGAGLPTNPMAGSADPNARRIVGFGIRNPFRFTIRPATNEVWLGDVGWNDYEEIDRIADPTSSPVANLGWPCFEGNGQQSALRRRPASTRAPASTRPRPGLLSPYFAYAHSATVVPGETCPTGQLRDRRDGVLPGRPLPGRVRRNAVLRRSLAELHLGDARRARTACPIQTQIETFVAGAANPVDLETGPNGDLFYVDFDGGTIHRVVFGGSNLAPTAVIKATPSSGPSPLTVALDGTGLDRPGGSCADLRRGTSTTTGSTTIRRRPRRR